VFEVSVLSVAWGSRGKQHNPRRRGEFACEAHGCREVLGVFGADAGVAGLAEQDYLAALCVENRRAA